MRHSGDFGFTLRLRTLTVLLCLLLWTTVHGFSRVIGPSQPITAAPGDDVILPCHLEPQLYVKNLTVEWSKPDLKPDPSDRLSRVEYVHLYRGEREIPDMKISSYARRTALFTDALKRGNISLKITNVTLGDQGRYRCYIPKLNSPVKEAIVELVVDPHFKTQTTDAPRNLPTPDPKDETNQNDVRQHQSVWISAVVVCVAVIVGGGVGFLLKHKSRKQRLPQYDDQYDAQSKPLPL